MAGEVEQRWRDLGAYIREQRRVGQLSLRRLSELAGVSNPYLSQIERGLRKPSADILQQIAGALQISAETLYVQAGILEDRTHQVDLVVEIRRDPDLSEDQKRTLVHIYESFRAEQRRLARVEPVPSLGEPPVAEGSQPPDGLPGPRPDPLTAEVRSA